METLMSQVRPCAPAKIAAITGGGVVMHGSIDVHYGVCRLLYISIHACPQDIDNSGVCAVGQYALD
jgi:hypothetical protein